jgi:hypothetical protein
LHHPHRQPFRDAKPNYRDNFKRTINEKQVLALDESKPKKPTRADRPPSEGFVTVVDGHFKSQF